ncbi:hypothetical protein MNEG_9867 [Monoraphidium neglectum]|uniref:RUN domain-containing protein n=1 Tax=Monoraphidium neglectum TaxID=145388 RepID=A0A0D2KR94_9CHLO|nr:hypothetical protein MNEG_9867 [Monoraphidium neglectum]KIY98093.1 hypothetical protein MNEG_9867 [Monoraphidium neglectum]|eukprot:XP_013897113.1 hypothetical protein MNEG_9867 [Monoraphidium neglectum]
MAHGLRQAAPAGGGGGWGIAGWLSSRRVTPFAVLLALEAGAKGAPRALLGAEGIASMAAARAAGDAARLDLWVRASLNEQLLGSRLAALAGGGGVDGGGGGGGGGAPALRAWYEPGAALLQPRAAAVVEPAAAAGRQPQQQQQQEQEQEQQQQQQQQGGELQALLEALRQLDRHRFALRVDAAGPAASAATEAAPAAVANGTAAVSSGGGCGGALSTFQWPSAVQPAGRRRVPAIADGAGPGAAGRAPGEEDESSDALSPLSTSDDAGGPDWWTGGPLPWHQMMKDSLASQGSGGTGVSGGDGAGGGGGGAAIESGARAGSSASAQLQLQLEAALAAPVPALLQRRRSLQGAASLVTARSTGSLRDKAGSPEFAEALAAAARRTGAGPSPLAPGGAGVVVTGAAGLGPGVGRHRHKRSSSFNDLAELQAQVAAGQR